MIRWILIVILLLIGLIFWQQIIIANKLKAIYQTEQGIEEQLEIMSFVP